MTPASTAATVPTDAGTATCAAMVPSHLVALPGGEWGVWRTVCVRGAGFAAHLVEPLAAPDCAAAADRLLASEAHAEAMKQQARAAYDAAAADTPDFAERKQFLRALKQVKHGKPPAYAPGPLAAVRDTLAQASRDVTQAHADFAARFADGVRDTSHYIRRAFADPRLREAMLLQNAAAYRRVRRGFEEERRRDARDPKRDYQGRQNEELIASYLQRYCLKNDTAGFFGPVGWAHAGTHDGRVTMVPGLDVMARSSVYFENWGIEALAARQAALPEMAPWMRPRLSPLFHLERHRLYVPGGASTELSPVHAAVLRLCDGEHRARDIARAIVQASPGRLSSETQVLALLKQLEAKNVLTWGFDIPFTLHPHEALRTLFESVEPDALRTPAIAALDALDTARLDVERAAGDPERLDTALQALERTFTSVTGQAPTRAAGAVYAARTLVYQDGMRDAKVDLGTKLLDDLGPPLSLLLTSTRWFTAQAAAAFRLVFDRIYREMEAQRGPNGIELIAFWLRAEPLLLNPAAGLLQPIVDDFQDRWRQLLAAPAGLRHVTRTAAELRPRVEDVFAAPPAPWQGGRYHSPDIMIAADSVEAIEGGDYAFVLGELHAAVNTIRGSFAVAQHPRPEELFAALEADADRPSLVPVLPRQWPRLTNRTTVALVSPRDYHCELSRHSLAGAPRERVLPISSLTVDRTSAGLVVRTRDGRLSFDIVDAFGETLSLNTLTRLSLFPRERYRPRISLDRLVISREAWTVDAATLPFLSLNDESARYLAARRWQQQLGLPRLAFVKVAIEPKPFFLDFDSPIYVEIFTKIARRVMASDDESHDIAISEMLPSPSQLWLSDAHGHRYTSELRIVARDCAAAEKQG